MEVRDVERSDWEGIAEVARASLAESYSHFIDESTIDDVVETWYSEDRVQELMDDDTEEFLVAEGEDGVVGFAHGAIVQEEPLAAELYWLHVDPSARASGIGVQLLGRIQDRFEDVDAEVFRGMVLAGNEDGADFYRDHGFEQAGSRTVDIGDEELEELVFEKSLVEGEIEEVVEPVDGPDGEELFANYSEGERGAKAPFYAVYLGRDLEERYGYQCGNCESLETTMDSMGRIVCESCGNKRKATRWDASYL